MLPFLYQIKSNQCIWKYIVLNTYVGKLIFSPDFLLNLLDLLDFLGQGGNTAILKFEIPPSAQSQNTASEVSRSIFTLGP
jgi:hypothetical protein